MACPFTNIADFATIDTNEYFLFSDSITATYQTTLSWVTGFIDFSGMTATETYDVSYYEKVNASSVKLITTDRLVGVQQGLYKIRDFALAEGYEVSVKKIAGTTRAIGWSMKRDTGDRNVVLWNGSAPDGLTSGKVAADVKLWLAVAPLGTTIAGPNILPQIDLQKWVSGTPNGLIFGRVDATVGAMANNVLTAAAINAAALTAAKFATDAIDANALKADAVTEIQAGLATSANQLALLALLHSNAVVDNTVHGANGTTSARLRGFASAAAAVAAVDGALDNADGETSRWTITTDYDGLGQIKTHRLSRTL